MKDIFYFLLGTVVGSMLALLFAPQSGEELRAKIQATAEEDWQKAQVQWQAELEKLHTRFDQLQVDLKQSIEAKEEAEDSEAEELAE